MPNKTFEITEETANLVLNYLASKPFIEVSTLITKLQEIKEIIKKEDTKK